ncbi:oligosaccharide flippase family protein [Arcobacter sp. YIC-464]|uniref:oligosaccharide flippase family protein n=1 Tax=Arcobacter sp. YIC-464 TaxID=3376631 RepID=UPI003C1C2EAD
MNLIKKILSSSLWLLIGNSIGRLAMFLANIFAARLLTQDQFGQFAMIRNTISSVEGLISGTLGSTVIKKVAETSHNEKENLPYLLSTIFIINIIISFCISLILFFFSDFIVEKFFLNNITVINALYIGIIILVTTTFSTLMQNILIGFEEFRKIATLSLITSTISIPIIFLSIYFFGLYGGLFGVSFYFAFDFMVKYFYYKKLNHKTKFELEKFKNESKRILLFSTPLLLAVIINAFTFWYARVLVINETNSFKEIAIFDAAFQWLTIIMIITSATTNVALSMLSKTSNDNTETKNIFITNLLVNLGISVVIAFVFMLFSKEIMSLYGKDYIIGSTTLIILSITSIFFTLATLYNRYMVSISKIWLLFFAALLGSIFMFIYLSFQKNLNSEILANSFLIYFLSGTIMYIISYYFIKRAKYA